MADSCRVILSACHQPDTQRINGADQAEARPTPSGHEAVVPYGSTATTFLTTNAFELAEHPLALAVPATRRLTRNNLPT